MKIKLNLDKYGGEHFAPVFSNLTAGDLKISKSYYNKIKKLLDQEKPIPKSIGDKIEKKLGKNKVTSIRLQENDDITISIPKTTISRIQNVKTITKENKRGVKRKVKPNYIWVKFGLYSQWDYYKSATIPISQAGKLNKFINEYIENEVQTYSESTSSKGIYIKDIVIQLI